MQLKKTDLTGALKILAADASVFVPGEIEGIKRFVLWDGESDVDLGGANTQLPPKDILFPCTEKCITIKWGIPLKSKRLWKNPNR